MADSIDQQWRPFALRKSFAASVSGVFVVIVVGEGADFVRQCETTLPQVPMPRVFFVPSLPDEMRTLVTLLTGPSGCIQPV